MNPLIWLKFLFNRFCVAIKTVGILIFSKTIKEKGEMGRFVSRNPEIRGRGRELESSRCVSFRDWNLRLNWCETWKRESLWMNFSGVASVMACKLRVSRKQSTQHNTRVCVEVNVATVTTSRDVRVVWLHCTKPCPVDTTGGVKLHQEFLHPLSS